MLAIATQTRARPQMIDNGTPAPGLLAQVALVKHDDHLPLYRQSEICARVGADTAGGLSDGKQQLCRLPSRVATILNLRDRVVGV